jgi:hypothetical protein
MERVTITHGLDVSRSYRTNLAEFSTFSHFRVSGSYAAMEFPRIYGSDHGRISNGLLRHPDQQSSRFGSLAQQSMATHFLGRFIHQLAWENSLSRGQVRLSP